MGRYRAAWLVFVLFGAACSGTDGAGPAPSTVPSPPSVAPATPSPAAITAADGRNARACSDGKCQILVEEQADFALDGRFGCDGVYILFDEPNEVTLQISVRESDDVTAVITGTGNVQLAYGFTITVQQTGPSGAVLRVAPAKNDPKNNKGTGTEGFSLFSTPD